jgi:hypothetical protein
VSVSHTPNVALPEEVKATFQEGFTSSSFISPPLSVATFRSVTPLILSRHFTAPRSSYRLFTLRLWQTCQRTLAPLPSRRLLSLIRTHTAPEQSAGLPMLRFLQAPRFTANISCKIPPYATALPAHILNLSFCFARFPPINKARPTAVWYLYRIIY